MDLGSIFSTAAEYAAYGAVGAVALNSVVLVKQGHKKIITSFGRSGRVVKEMTGNGLVLPWQGATNVATMTKTYSDENEPLVVATKDTNGVRLPVKIAASVVDANQFEFQNDNPIDEMKSTIYEAIRDACSDMTTEELYTDRNKLKDELMTDASIQKVMTRLGIQLENMLIDEPQPPKEWIEAKNKIRRAELDQEAARFEAAALKTRLVGEAEARAEARALEGKGAADFKTAIIEGIGEEMKKMVDDSNGELTVKDAMNLVLTVFELEVRESAATGPNNTFFFEGEKGNAAGFDRSELIAALQSAFPGKGPSAFVGGSSVNDYTQPGPAIPARQSGNPKRMEDPSVTNDGPASPEM